MLLFVLRKGISSCVRDNDHHQRTTSVEDTTFFCPNSTHAQKIVMLKAGERGCLAWLATNERNLLVLLSSVPLVAVASLVHAMSPGPVL
jgi:hypothetical protein